MACAPQAPERVAVSFQLCCRRCAASARSRSPSGSSRVGALNPAAAPAKPVGADNAVTSRDLRILVDQATKPVTSSDADFIVSGRDGDLAVGWSLAEGPVRPA